MKTTQLNCIGVNSGDMQPEFIQWLGTDDAGNTLIIRRLSDDSLNVVVSTDESELIPDKYESSAKWLEEQSKAGIHYVFISQDFGH